MDSSEGTEKETITKNSMAMENLSLPTEANPKQIEPEAILHKLIDSSMNFTYLKTDSEAFPAEEKESHKHLRRLTTLTAPAQVKSRSRIDELTLSSTEGVKNPGKPFSQECFKDLKLFRELEMSAENIWLRAEVGELVNCPAGKSLFSAMVCERSALEIPLLKSLEKQEQVQALEISDLVFSYLESGSVAEVKAIIEILTKALADEVILQIFKQLNSNPNGAEVLKLHQLYAMIITHHPPSDNLFRRAVPHILYLIESNLQHPEMNSLLRYNAFRTVSSFNASPQRLPFPVEEELTTVAGMRKVAIDIYLFSEARQTFYIESFTKVEDLREMIASHFDLMERLPFLGIMLAIAREGKPVEELLLSGSDYVMDIIGAMCHEKQQLLIEKMKKQPKRLSITSKPSVNLSEKEFSYKLYFCVEVYYKLRAKDVDAISLFYMQHKREVRANSFPLTEFDLINLCALNLLIEGRGPGPEAGFEVTEPMIRDLVPDSLLKINHPEVWCDPIGCCYMSFLSKGLSREELKHEYLMILEKYDLFCSRKYRAMYRELEPVEFEIETPREMFRKIVTLGIKPMKVVIADNQTKKTIRIIEFANILKWGTHMRSIFTVFTDDNHLHFFELDTADEIDHLMTEYSNLALGHNEESPIRRRRRVDRSKSWLQKFEEKSPFSKALLGRK